MQLNKEAETDEIQETSFYTDIRKWYWYNHSIPPHTVYKRYFTSLNSIFFLLDWLLYQG